MANAMVNLVLEKNKRRGGLGEGALAERADRATQEIRADCAEKRAESNGARKSRPLGFARKQSRRERRERKTVGFPIGEEARNPIRKGAPAAIEARQAGIVDRGSAHASPC